VPRTTFRSGLPRPATDERIPDHPGDAPPVPAEAPTRGWSLTHYPHPAPADDDADGDAT